MAALMYLLGLIVLFCIVLAVLPIVLPILFLIVVIAAGLMLYMRYKVKKNMEDFTRDADKMNQSFSQSYTRTTQSTHHEDVIDVEYTEHDADDV